MNILQCFAEIMESTNKGLNENMFLSLFTMTHISGITFSVFLSDESEAFPYFMSHDTME